MVRCAVIGKRDRRAAGEQRAIEFNGRHPSRNIVRVLDDDFVARRVMAECDLKAPPAARDARVEMKSRAPQMEPQDPLNAGPIHPTR